MPTGFVALLDVLGFSELLALEGAEARLHGRIGRAGLVRIQSPEPAQ